MLRGVKWLSFKKSERAIWCFWAMVYAESPSITSYVVAFISLEMDAALGTSKTCPIFSRVLLSRFRDNMAFVVVPNWLAIFQSESPLRTTCRMTSFFSVELDTCVETLFGGMYVFLVGTFNFQPARMKCLLLRPLKATIFLTLVPYLRAMPDNDSPVLTLWTI